MPPKVSFPREKIVAAAVQLVREEGIEQLNARSLASALHSSTQPIYRVFGSIKEVEEAVIKKLIPLALRFMLEETDSESEFLSIGLGYLKFARQEPRAYELLFLSGRKKWDLSPDSPFVGALLKKMRKDPFLDTMQEATLLRLYRDMFIYTHGLCSLTSIDFKIEDPAMERKLLHDTGGQLIAMAVLMEENPGFFEEMALRRRIK